MSSCSLQCEFDSCQYSTFGFRRNWACKTGLYNVIVILILGHYIEVKLDWIELYINLKTTIYSGVRGQNACGCILPPPRNHL
jgi:hypothetical protein